MTKLIEVSGTLTDFDDLYIGQEVYYKDDIWLLTDKKMGEINMEYVTLERCIKKETGILQQIFLSKPFFTLEKEQQKFYKHQILKAYVIEWKYGKFDDDDDE